MRKCELVFIMPATIGVSVAAPENFSIDWL